MMCIVLINFQIILLGYQLYLPTVGYYNNILILLMSLCFHCFLMNPLTELLSYLFPCYQHILSSVHFLHLQQVLLLHADMENVPCKPSADRVFFLARVNFWYEHTRLLSRMAKILSSMLY